MADQRWIRTWEGPVNGEQVTARERVRDGHSLQIGREGDMPIAVAVPNSGISRVAATVVSREHGWEVAVTNRNGAVLHAWGQAPELARASEVVNWPLVGIRMLHDGGSSDHWVLLEAPDIPITTDGATPDRGGAGLTTTSNVMRPGQLPPSEDEALRTVFAELLQWPPRGRAEPLQLIRAARQIGIQVTSLQSRLTNAKRRALRLGLDRDVRVTDPAYLYILVRAGYLDPPNTATQNRRG